MTQPQSTPGWHPVNHTGTPTYWWWDGYRWLDPAVEFERVMTEAMMPHLEKVFAEGFRHGAALASRAARSVLGDHLEGT